jgi:TrmH family RNA methyltransferase
MVQRITSTSNPRVKEIVRLQKGGAERRDSGLFCIERTRELTRAIDAGFEPVELFVVPEKANDPALLAAAAKGAPVVEVSPEVLAKMAYQENPQGFLAVMRAKFADPAKLYVDGGLYVVLSGLEKPGNVGAILRTADAAGATGVLIDAPAFDLFNPNCIRASTGAVFSVPVVCGERTQIVGWLREQRVQIVAATPEATRRYTAADLKGSTAIVMGAEAEGLDKTWREAADLRVSIPMHGAADSLNVSVTAALLLFEAVRQRG